LHEFNVLAVGVINAIAGADYGVLDGTPCDPDARREIGSLGVNEGARKEAGVGAVGVGQHGGGLGEVVASVKRGEVVVLLRVGREVFVAQAGQYGEIGPGAPVILSVSVNSILTQIGLLVRSLQAGLLGKAKEQIGKG
jgi:hypothetical protein